MAPAGQGFNWSEVLCCPLCAHHFSATRQPVNLLCGHSLCRPCCDQLRENACPLDQTAGTVSLRDLPVNAALLSIVGVDVEGKREGGGGGGGGRDAEERGKCDAALLAMASLLRRCDSERGGSVWSEVLSRTLQRKLVSLLCMQLAEGDGRARAIRTVRAIAERVLSELLLALQNSHHLSTHLWMAVRARGCQFLGPAMQEDVLKLILLTLGKGALIARKTLVMYAVQMLAEDYPQVSKTCVGHVVQLLYRASCFNVLKRDGESSLMQLKEEFRTYDSLRREHDAQIVQMALEAGLRISPDQWSSLLYGDQSHRSHMQSIIDRLQSPQSLQQGVDELRAAAATAAAGEAGSHVAAMLPLIAAFQAVHPTHAETVSWTRMRDLLEKGRELLDLHAAYITRRNEQRSHSIQQAIRRGSAAGMVPSGGVGGGGGGGGMLSGGNERAGGAATAVAGQRRFKTRMCRDVGSARGCPRGNRCTYAHSKDELRAPSQGGPPPQHAVQTHHMHMQQMYPQPHHHHHPHPMQQMQSPSGVVIQPMHPIQPVVMNGGMAGASNAVMMPMQQQPVQMMAPPQPQPGPVIVMPPSAGAPVVWSPTPVSTPTGGGGGGGYMLPVTAPPQQCSQTVWIPSSPGYDDFWLRTAAMTTTMIQPAAVQHHVVKLDAEAEAEMLHIKREEIINRLAPLSLSMDDDCDDGLDGLGHVSYTVASSVLDDRFGELGNHTPIPLELPPIPISYSAVLATPIDDTILLSGVSMCGMSMGMSVGVSVAGGGEVRPRVRTGSVCIVSCAAASSVRTVCPTTLVCGGGVQASTATVQADSTRMRVSDSLVGRQPLPTPSIQPSHMAAAPPAPQQVGSAVLSDPSRLPRVIRPMPAQTADPQHLVSATLDKIVDVKEKLNETSAGNASSALNQQLRVELSIHNRQIDALDARTTQSCLLKELQAVEKRIEEIEGGDAA